jgi:hypothetical protein
MLIIATVIGVITAIVASYRGRNVIAWFFLGFLFGVMGLLLLFFLPDHSKKDDEEKKITVDVKIWPAIDTIDEYEETDEYEWFYLDSQHSQHGGIDTDGLRAVWQEGAIDETTYIWHDGMEQWKPICEVSFLKNLFNIKG